MHSNGRKIQAAVLFVFFLFYEIAVLPMYLLIGIWGSSGEVLPQGIFGRKRTL